MKEKQINKENLLKRGFRQGNDGIYRKLNALERCEENGWLDFGDKRFSASDRKSIGIKFYRDYQKSRISGVSALNPEKIRVDGMGNQVLPDDIAQAEDLYRKAIKVIPESCFEVVHRICIDDLDFAVDEKLNRYQNSKEKVKQATLLCIGLDELRKFYFGLRKI